MIQELSNLEINQVSGGFLGAILGTIAAPVIGGLVGDLFGGSSSPLGPSPAAAGQQAQQMADPFAPYRPQYAQQLNALMANPASVQNLPGYQAQMQQGTQAVERALAARGQTQSGVERMSLLDYGSWQQNQYFQQQLANLSGLSGAYQSPYMGGQAGIQAAGQAAQTRSANVGAIAGPVGNVLSTMFGGSSQPTAMNTAVDPGTGQLQTIPGFYTNPFTTF